jgi:hypothetical protein
VTLVIDEATVCRFRRDGYVVLRGAIDPQPLSNEVDDALARGMRTDAPINLGSGGVGFHSVIMMCDRTPVSLHLVDLLSAAGAQLLGRTVLPGRAKGTRYFDSSRWHVDSDLPIDSVGFVAYLEQLTASTGALRVRPGSHRGETGDEVVVETRPVDLVAFDEHLVHGSVGGAVRRQWRIDFIVDPVDDTEAAYVRATFARIFDPTWDGGDDPDAYPSYGAHWQSLDRPWHQPLRRLGVYDLAERHREAMRLLH